MRSLCCRFPRGWLRPLIRRCFRQQAKYSDTSSSGKDQNDIIPAGFVSVPPEWVEYPRFPPPTPQVLLDNRDRYEAAMDYRKSSSHPGNDDTPLYALYRLYETIVLDRNIDMRNEIEYFWRKRAWSVHEIPDPADSDPARYAVLACIPPLLAKSYNRLIGLGLPRDAPGIMTNEEFDEMKSRPKIFERAPEWASSVPPLGKLLKIPHRKHGYDGPWETVDDFDDVRASDPFKEKNILIWEPHIYFT